jgi:hypothetical protein
MGARFWRLRPEKKDTVVCLLGARIWRLRPEKKDTVVCLTGCAVVLFFVVAGNFDYNRKKKRYSRLSGGCAIIIMTGKKKYNRQYSICISST